jgi:hypothetical protein
MSAICIAASVIFWLRVLSLSIEADFSLPADRVIRSLNQIIKWRD